MDVARITAIQGSIVSDTEDFWLLFDPSKVIKAYM